MPYFLIQYLAVSFFFCTFATESFLLPMRVKSKYSQYVTYICLPRYVGQFLRRAYHSTEDGVIFIPTDYFYTEHPPRYRLEVLHEMVHDTFVNNLTATDIRTKAAMSYSELNWQELPDTIKSSKSYFAFALPKEVPINRARTSTLIEASPILTLHSEWVSVFRLWCSNFFWQHLKLFIMRHQDAGTIPLLSDCIAAFMTKYGIDEDNQSAVIKNYSRNAKTSDKFTDKLIKSVNASESALENS